MKKLIFLFISIFVIWKYNIVDIALNKYFEWKYNQDTSKLTIYDDKSPSLTIDTLENIVMPKTKTKQYLSNKEKLDSVVVPHIKLKKRIQRQSKPKKIYKCDGRQHCSQMKSYEEAKFFIQNCPRTKMDGDNDGIPCERQFRRYD